MGISDSANHESIIEYRYKDFGRVIVKVHELMDKQGLSISRMAGLAAIQHRVVKKYYKQEPVRVDLETLAKFCFILKCDIADILCYTVPDHKEMEI